MSKTLDGTGRLLGLTVDPNDTNVNKLIVSSTTSSGSSTTGALTVAGGVGIAGNLNVGGSITGGSISYASTTTGTLNVTNTTDSTSTTTGVLTVAGGVGIAKQVFVGSNTDVTGRLRVGYSASKEALINLGQTGAGSYRSAYIYESAAGNMEINNQENGDLTLSTNNAAKITVKPDGKVGIGTSSPSNTLEVVGAVNCTSLTVNGTVSCTSISTSGGAAILFATASYAPNLDIFAASPPSFYTFTNTTSSGQYVKVGNLVTYTFDVIRRINFSGPGVYAPAISITLPFAAAQNYADIQGTGYIGSSSTPSNAQFTASNAYITSGQSIAYLSNFFTGTMVTLDYLYARGRIIYFTS